jgi:hypothetical protein
MADQGASAALVLCGAIVLCYWVRYVRKAAGGISGLAAAKARALGVGKAGAQADSM